MGDRNGLVRHGWGARLSAESHDTSRPVSHDGGHARRYVVGTAEVRVEVDGSGSRAVPLGLRHALDPNTLAAACGQSDLETFAEIDWDARATAPLCQRCLRALAHWPDDA